MYHYQHNVMGERADCGKMAAMCGRSRLRRKTSTVVFIYIYGSEVQVFPQSTDTVVGGASSALFNEG